MSESLDLHMDAVAAIVVAYVSNNAIAASELPGLIGSVRAALEGTAAAGRTAPESEPLPLVPAVPIKKSITPDYLISLEDGKKFKSLRRYLATSHGMTPHDYRKKWGLPADYPMVAPNYAAARSALARRMGLGRKRTEASATEVEIGQSVEAAPPPEPKSKRGRVLKAS